MTEIAERVKAIIVENLGVSETEVTPEATFAQDLGADSLDTVELIMKLEQAFDIKIPETESENIQTVGDAIAYLGQMVAGLFTMNLGGIAYGKKVLLWCLLLVVVEWMQRKREHPLDFRGLSFFERYRACRWAVYYLVTLIIIFARGEGQTFIYFQF